MAGGGGPQGPGHWERNGETVPQGTRGAKWVAETPVTDRALEEIQKKKRRFTTSFTGKGGAQDSVLLDIPTLGGGSGKSLLGQ